VRPLEPPQIPFLTILTPACFVTLQARQPAAFTFFTRSPTPCQARLALFFYPYWKATGEAHAAIATVPTPEGLLLVSVPAGQHTLKLAFHPASTARTVGFALTLFAACLIAAGLLAWRMKSPYSEATTPSPSRTPASP
jgi:hypothetical protein